MELGEMATLTQTIPDEMIEVIAKAFDRKIEIVHAAEEAERRRSSATPPRTSSRGLRS